MPLPKSDEMGLKFGVNNYLPVIGGNIYPNLILECNFADESCSKIQNYRSREMLKALVTLASGAVLIAVPKLET